MHTQQFLPKTKQLNCKKKKKCQDRQTDREKVGRKPKTEAAVLQESGYKIINLSLLKRIYLKALSF